MDNKEIWNRIVALHEQYYDAPERPKIQSLWESIFTQFFGYLPLSDELNGQETINVAHTAVKLDILLKSKGKPLCAVELKQHWMPITTKASPTFEEQLDGYLRLLNLNIGLLICNSLYIFIHDFNKNELIRAKIEFVEDNADGVKFVEMFKKENFDKTEIENFVKQKNLFIVHKNEMIKKLSPEFIKDVVKLYFMDNNKDYTENEIDTVLSSCEINISLKTGLVTPFPSPIKPKPYMGHHPVTPNNMKYIKLPAAHEGATNITGNKLSRKQAQNICYKNAIDVRGFYNLSNWVDAFGKYIYWVDADIKSVEHDWYLLFNDEAEKLLHVFKIPKNSYSKDNFYIKDPDTAKEKIDIKCNVDDPDFNIYNAKIKIDLLSFEIAKISY